MKQFLVGLFLISSYSAHSFNEYSNVELECAYYLDMAQKDRREDMKIINLSAQLKNASSDDVKTAESHRNFRDYLGHQQGHNSGYKSLTSKLDNSFFKACVNNDGDYQGAMNIAKQEILDQFCVHLSDDLRGPCAVQIVHYFAPATQIEGSGPLANIMYRLKNKKKEINSDCSATIVSDSSTKANSQNLIDLSSDVIRATSTVVRE